MAKTTFDRVSELMGRTKGLVAAGVYDDWKALNECKKAEVDNVYRSNGDPAVCCLVGKTDEVALAGYRWSPKIGNQSFEAQSQARDTGSLFFSSNWSKLDYTDPALRGAVIVVHGVTEYAMFSLLQFSQHSLVPHWSEDAHKVTQDELDLMKHQCTNSPVYQMYTGSWCEKLNENGYVVYALDMQGHGLSQRWRKSSCNVERFTDFADHLIKFVHHLFFSSELNASVDIFLQGASMGGCILTRTVQRAFAHKQLRVKNHHTHNHQGLMGDAHVPVDRKNQSLELPVFTAENGKMDFYASVANGENDDPKVPPIAGVILVCPAISAERLKKKFPNQVILPVMNLVSKIAPRVKLATLQKELPFEFLNALIAKDPLYYKESIPVRLASEVLLEMDCIMVEVSRIPSDLPFLLIQSKLDTMTDPEGSQKFMDSIQCTDKHAHWLDYGWHFLSKEPGNMQTCNFMVNWMRKRSK